MVDTINMFECKRQNAKRIVAYGYPYIQTTSWSTIGNFHNTQNTIHQVQQIRKGKIEFGKME